jgi:hypothetical protein
VEKKLIRLINCSAKEIVLSLHAVWNFETYEKSSLPSMQISEQLFHQHTESMAHHQLE